MRNPEVALKTREVMEHQFKSHSFSKVILCRKRCYHCKKSIRFFGFRCRICRIKCHKSCSELASQTCHPRPRKHNGKSKAFRLRLKINGHRTDACDAVPTIGWGFGERYGVHVGKMQPYTRFVSNRVNLNQSPMLWNCGRGGFLTSSVENIVDGEDYVHYPWHLPTSNRSRQSSSTYHGTGLRPPSAVSSGYSSVNQSCASSAGSGSQRSRSPTPDHFETVREESPVGEAATLGYDDLYARRSHHLEKRAEGLTVCGGVDRRITKAPVRGNPVSFWESDEESSGEFEGCEKAERPRRKRSGLHKSLKELEIPYSDLEIDAKIGAGPHGSVYRGRYHGDVLIHTRKATVPEEIEEFRNEVALLSIIRHENVMLFMGACLEPPNLAVVVSLRKCNSIHHHLHCQESRWSMATRLNVMLQIAQGMSYLHAKCITVPCLRTMNIFLESKVKLCVNDYTYLHHQVRRDGYGSVPQGHFTYLAPEVISRMTVDPVTGRIVDARVRTRKMDVYAYGTVMYEILTDKWPFANLWPETVIWMIGNGLPHSLAKVKGPDTVKDLIKSCWSHDPNQRPSFVRITQVLKQKNLSASCISRRHSVSEPEKLQYAGKLTDYCPVRRV